MEAICQVWALLNEAHVFCRRGALNLALVPSLFWGTGRFDSRTRKDDFAKVIWIRGDYRLKDAATTARRETSEAAAATWLQPSARTPSPERGSSGRAAGTEQSRSGALKITAFVTRSPVCCPRQQPRKRLAALSSNTRYFLSSSFSLATSRTVTQPQRRQEDAERGAAMALFFFAPLCHSYFSIPFGFQSA